MKQSDLQFILESGEGQFVEFKESPDKSLSKEITAFANASGGSIYIGISDNGEIKGISITNKLKSEIQDIARNCDPPVIISIEEMDNILAITVKEGANKPYSCSSGFYMRMGANSQKMNRDEILALAVKSGKVRFDEQICANFEWTDFDDEKLKYFLKLAKISYNLERDEVLTNLRVLNNDGFTNAGVLFFAKEPGKYIISSKIRCIHFKDDKRLDILDKKVIDRGIIGNIEFALEYLTERVPVKYEIKKLARDEYPEYPVSAYREAIINSIIHFDYFLGDSVAIEKLKDRIILVNKGELLFPEADFGKRSEPRNRLMADLLSRTDYMEKAGTGVKRIREACNKNGNKVEFFFSDAFRIEIYSNTSEKNVPENVPGNVPENVPENRELKILDIVKLNSKVTIGELADILEVDPKTIKRDITKLKKEQLLKRIGPDKGGHWEVVKD